MNDAVGSPGDFDFQMYCLEHFCEEVPPLLVKRLRRIEKLLVDAEIVARTVQERRAKDDERVH